MGTPLSPEVNSIRDCRQDCPLLDSCRAQDLKRCPMQLKAATISLPITHSLLLHVVVAAIVLMLPVYEGGSGQRSFMSYRVFLAGEEATGRPHAVSAGGKNDAAQRLSTQPENAARLKQKEEVEKIRETPAKNSSPGPAEKAPQAVAPVAEKAPQRVPPKAEEAKADTAMAEEVIRSAVAAADNSFQDVSSETQEVKAAAEVKARPDPAAVPAAEKAPQRVPPKVEQAKADTAMAEEVIRSAVAAADNSFRDVSSEAREVKSAAEVKARPHPAAIPAAKKAPQRVPPKVEQAKADTAMAEEAAKDSAKTGHAKVVRRGDVSAARKSASARRKSSAPSRMTEAAALKPGMGQFMKEFLQDMQTLLSYHGESRDKSPEAANGPKATITGAAGKKPAQQEVAAATDKGGSKAPATGQMTAPNSEAAAAVVSGQVGAATPAPLAGGQQVAAAEALPHQMQQEKASGAATAELPTATNEEKRASVGISGAAALLPRDIIIKVLVSGEDSSSVFTRLLRRSYPSPDLENVGEKARPVKVEEESGSTGSDRTDRILSVVNADKGIYTFVMANAGSKACVAHAVFLLFEKTSKERTKEYKVIQLSPGTGVRFKFLVPDGIFWDDDDRFTGSMEDSDSITKFNSDTGLVWREAKDDEKEGTQW
jgi:hypothetical protein